MGDEHDSENLERYSFTIPRKLVESIDKLIEKRDVNRSMVVREALSHWVDHATKSVDIDLQGEGVASISYIYDHHDNRVVTELIISHHQFHNTVSTTTHVHLSHNECYEITICKGKLGEIKKLGEKISSIKGIHSFYINYARSEFGEKYG